MTPPEYVNGRVILDPEGPNVDQYGNRFSIDPESIVWADRPDYAQFCGCGNPEDVNKYMLRYLQTLDAEWDQRPSLSVQQEACGGEVAWMLLAYMADALGWTEHGTSICGAWLTDAGRMAMRGIIDVERHDV